MEPKMIPDLTGSLLPPEPYPGRWTYTWLAPWPGMAIVERLPGGPDVEGPDGRVDPEKWRAVMDSRPKPPPIHTSVFHQHVADCWDDTPLYLQVKWDGSGMWLRQCVQTGFWREDHVATPSEMAAEERRKRAAGG